MSEIQTFVTIHDQDILLDCESSGQFSTLSDVTYLFVGVRPIDRIPAHIKHVVCRDFSPNMEHLPDFYDYTGWFVLWKNQLVTSPNVLMIQYDMRPVVPNVEQHCAQALSTHGMVAFQTASMPMLFLDNEEFGIPYRNAMMRLGSPVELWPPRHEWPTSQGTAWRTDVFYRYMRWFEPCFEEFAGHRFCGHLAERTLAAFTSLYTDVAHLPGVIQHDNRDCHGTCDLLNGNQTSFEQKRTTFAL